MIPSLIAVGRITRGHNCLAAALATGLGAYLNAPAAEWGWPRWRAMLIVGLVVAAGNVVNDLQDHDVDRIAKPGRPLPSGALGVVMARLLAVALVAGSLILVAALPPALVLFAVSALTLGLAYSRYLKSTLLVGNAVVAALSASTLLFGGMNEGSPGPPVLAATTIVFLFLLGREILKDVADHDGDAAMEITTVSTRLGQAISLRLVTASMSLFAVAATVPWAAGMADERYLAVMWVAAVAPTLGGVTVVHAKPSPENIERTLRLTKVAWFSGLTAMLLLV